MLTALIVSLIYIFFESLDFSKFLGNRDLEIEKLKNKKFKRFLRNSKYILGKLKESQWTFVIIHIHYIALFAENLKKSMAISYKFRKIREFH